MTEAQYTAFRPILAGLLKVPEVGLASQAMSALNLSALGATVNVMVGQTPPSGFRWDTDGVETCSVVQSTSGFAHGRNEGLLEHYYYVLFSADNAPPGTYLMTVYLDTLAATVQCYVRDSGESPAVVGANVQGNMINVPFVKTSTGPLALTVFMPPGARDTSVYSCDFMRIR